MLPRPAIYLKRILERRGAGGQNGLLACLLFARKGFTGDLAR